MPQTNDEKLSVLRALNPGDVLNTVTPNHVQWVAIMRDRVMANDTPIYSFSLCVTIGGLEPHTISLQNMLSEDYLMRSEYIAVAAMHPAHVPVKAGV